MATQRNFNDCYSFTGKTLGTGKTNWITALVGRSQLKITVAPFAITLKVLTEQLKRLERTDVSVMTLLRLRSSVGCFQSPPTRTT